MEMIVFEAWETFQSGITVIWYHLADTFQLLIAGSCTSRALSHAVVVLTMMFLVAVEIELNT